MKSQKRVVQSALLNRMAHADVFEIGPAPRFLFVLFGGSGLEEEEYERRRHSVIPVFGPVLENLARHSLSLVLAYVSAPYDVPFNRFAAEPPAADTWNAHVTKELLEPWSTLPYFVCGFSGGAALALNGLEKSPRCFGGAGLGADAIPMDFVCPEHWAEKLQLYSARDDRVCNHPSNRQSLASLVQRGQAELVQLHSGNHVLADYCTADGLGQLIRFASDISPR